MYYIIETEIASLTARNIRGANIIARQDAAGTTLYYLYNGHGDVVQLADSTGVVKNAYSYNIYGLKKTATENSLANPARYAGEYFDSESGMYYLRARYYNPEIMRFIAEDTYEGDVSDPLSLNLYAYCKGNPIIYVDPSDNEPIYDLGKGWYGRKDPADPGAGEQEHMHIYNEKKDEGQWSQNKDGSPHKRGQNSPGTPPNKVKKKLKEKQNGIGMKLNKNTRIKIKRFKC